MAITEVDQLLSDFLNQSKADEATRTIAFIKVSREETQQIKMCRFLADNPQASSDQILAEARKIAEA